MDKLKAVYYINLAHRTDRNEQMIHEFEKLNFQQYERFDAATSQYGGANGCTLSHFRLWDKIANLPLDTNDGKIPYVLILEDDAKFTVNRSILDQYLNTYYQLTNQRKLLALGYNMNIKQRYAKSKLFHYGLKFLTTSDYIIPIRLARKFIVRLQKKKINYQNDSKTGIVIDLYIQHYQHYRYYLVPDTHIVIQRRSHSDIIGRPIYYGV